jgi:hypothetical protein
MIDFIMYNKSVAKGSQTTFVYLIVRARVHKVVNVFVCALCVAL